MYIGESNFRVLTIQQCLYPYNFLVLSVQQCLYSYNFLVLSVQQCLYSSLNISSTMSFI